MWCILKLYIWSVVVLSLFVDRESSYTEHVDPVHIFFVRTYSIELGDDVQCE